MKTRSKYCLWAVVFLMIFLLAGCDLGLTIDGRASAFLADINRTPADTRGIVDNFHTSMTGRALWNNDASFNGTELDYALRTFTLALGASTDIGGGRKRQTGTLTNLSGGHPITIEYLQDGINGWAIIYMSCGGDTWGS